MSRAPATRTAIAPSICSAKICAPISTGSRSRTSSTGSAGTDGPPPQLAPHRPRRDRRAGQRLGAAALRLAAGCVLLAGRAALRRRRSAEERMTGAQASDQESFIYAGLAGETGPGRLVQSGLYRLADGEEEWEPLQRGLPERPAVRALAVHPQRPEIVYAGTQQGLYRSADRGEHWERLPVPDHGLPVWSLLLHPRNPDVLLVGYENCEISRSDDAGEHWTRLPVSVRFPEITTAPGANPAKRVLRLDADMVDMHGVLISRWRPGAVYATSRAGLFCSADGGEHWRHVALEPLNAKGQIYCRDIRAVPGTPRRLWVAAGAGFQSDVGALLRSSDGGDSWSRVDIGFP